MDAVEIDTLVSWKAHLRSLGSCDPSIRDSRVSRILRALVAAPFRRVFCDAGVCGTARVRGESANVASPEAI